MFTNLLETQKPLITILIFVGTFLVTLTIGRLLKRRAGVRLGVLFRLLCFILAFYAAASFYGLNVSWRNHVDAAAIWLSTAFIVALLDRYLWDAYFEKKRQTPIPQFLRQVIGLLLFLIALLIVLRGVLSRRRATGDPAGRFGDHRDHHWVGHAGSSGRNHRRISAANQQALQGRGLAQDPGSFRRSDGDQLALDQVADERRDLPRRSQLLHHPGNDRQPSLPDANPCDAHPGRGRLRRSAQPGQGRAPSRDQERRRRRAEPRPCGSSWSISRIRP